MNKKKKDFFQELSDRNVMPEIKAYLFGGAAMISVIGKNTLHRNGS